MVHQEEILKMRDELKATLPSIILLVYDVAMRDFCCNCAL